MHEHPYSTDYFKKMRCNPYIIYVENYYNKDINEFITKNGDIEGTTIMFYLQELGFIYPPEILQNKSFLEMLGYNRPYLMDVLPSVSSEDLYNYLFKKHGLSEEKGSYFLDLTGEYLTEPVPFPTMAQYITSINFIGDEVKRMREEELERESPTSRQKKWRVEKIPAPIDMALSLEEPALYYEQYQQLADEILQRVETLKEFGAFTVLADIIEEITDTSQTLSSLLITDDYRIFLSDYQMKEIKLRPIEKALYLLYLKHPEGINFKELAQHKEELLYIYRDVSLREDVDSMRFSIDTLTDPTNNSINEKVSRIRTAFITQISEKLAKNYYISGTRGENKSITLDRSLVVYE